MKKLFYGLALSLSFLCSPMIYANLTDGQKCMQGFLHDCLNTIDTNTLEASFELSKGYGAFKQLEKIWDSWQQLRMYLVASGLSYHKTGSSENTFEAQFCKPIDEAIEHIKNLNKVEDQRSALLDIVAKIHLIITANYQNQLRISHCDPDNTIANSIKLKKEDLLDEYKNCLRVWSIFSSDLCKPLDDCRKHFSAIMKIVDRDALEKPSNISWSSFIYGWLGWGNGSLSDQVDVHLNAIHKELLFFKQQFQWLESPYIENKNFSIIDIKNIHGPKPIGMFSLETLNPGKWELVQKTSAILFFALSSPYIQDEAEKILKKLAEYQANQKETSWFIQQLGLLLKRAVISQDLEDTWTDIASHTKAVSDLMYAFWTNSSSELPRVKLQRWQSLCSTLKQNDHEVLLYDLAEYATRKDSFNLHSILFPGANKQEFSGQQLYGEDEIKQLTYQFIEQDFLDGIEGSDSFLSVQDRIHKDLMQVYDACKQDFNLKNKYFTELYSYFSKKYPEYDKKYNDVYYQQYHAIISDFYNVLHGKWIEVLEGYEIKHKDAVFSSEDLNSLGSSFDKYVDVADGYKDSEQKYLTSGQQCTNLWNNFFSLPLYDTYTSPSKSMGFLWEKVTFPAKLVYAGYVYREAMVDYNCLQNRYEKLHNNYQRNSEWYAVASTAKTRLQKKIEKQ